MRYLFSAVLSLVIVSGYAQDRKNILADSIWGHYIYKYTSEYPLIDSKNVYVGADVAPLTCLDKKSGKVIWTIDVPVGGYKSGFIHSVVDAGNDKILVNGMSKNLYMLDKKTGKILWTYVVDFDDDLKSYIQIIHDTIYINPESPYLIALNMDGQEIWKSNIGNNCTGYSISGDEIICQLYRGGCCIIDRKNGALIKQKTIFETTAVLMHRPFMDDSIIMMGNGTDSLVVLNRKDFSFAWGYSHAKNYIYHQGFIYVYNDIWMKKLDAHSGKEIWTIDGDFAWHFEPSFFEGKIYIQARHNFVIANDHDGKVLYACKFGHKSYTNPIIEKGIIYVGIASHYMALKDPTSK